MRERKALFPKEGLLSYSALYGTLPHYPLPPVTQLGLWYDEWRGESVRVSALLGRDGPPSFLSVSHPFSTQA
jgi:hypothetical protein